MALQLQKKENLFQLSGRLHSCTVKEIRPLFILRMQEVESLTIDISKLDDIDLSGAMFLSELYESSNKRFVNFSILIRDNKKILGPFRQLHSEFILAA